MIGSYPEHTCRSRTVSDMGASVRYRLFRVELVEHPQRLIGVNNVPRMRGAKDGPSSRIIGLICAPVLVVLVVACNSAADSSTSIEQTTQSSLFGIPCVSASGEITSDIGVTVQAGGDEVAAVLGWVSAAPCSGDGPEVVGDGFFESLEAAVVGIDVGDRIRVLAPGFDAAHFEPVWSGEAGSGEILADSSKVEPGVWEITEFPSEEGVHVLNLRFEYGEDNDAAFAVTVDIRS